MGHLQGRGVFLNGTTGCTSSRWPACWPAVWPHGKRSKWESRHSKQDRRCGNGKGRSRCVALVGNQWSFWKPPVFSDGWVGWKWLNWNHLLFHVKDLETIKPEQTLYLCWCFGNPILAAVENILDIFFLGSGRTKSWRWKFLPKFLSLGFVFLVLFFTDSIPIRFITMKNQQFRRKYVPHVPGTLIKQIQGKVRNKSLPKVIQTDRDVRFVGLKKKLHLLGAIKMDGVFVHPLVDASSGVKHH